MENNIELRLIGITYNQIESGVYALVLEDPIDGKRLAIVIGYPEAQSIECCLQKVRTPRPLTHDVMVAVMKELGATLQRVDIHRLPTGPYAGKITLLTKDGELKYIDARSSDAIAFAIRVGAPIFTNRSLLEKEGYIPNSKPSKQKTSGVRIASTKEDKYRKLSLGQLEEKLAQCVIEENYEDAAEIKKEIEKRKSSQNPSSDK